MLLLSCCHVVVDRTKALVLELLAAVCLVSGGHTVILESFSNFKEVSESRQQLILSPVNHCVVG